MIASDFKASGPETGSQSAGKILSGHEPVTILLVEDDPGHARLIRKNLKRAGITNNVIAVDNGQSAVDFLFREGDYQDRQVPEPVLVLLDLTLPVLDGYQVLQRTKTDHPHEISRCYELGCNVYVTKPVEYEGFAEAVRNLGLFLSIVKIPQS